MAETGIKWVHSNGPNNKNPNLDLGGSPSVFEIASVSMNNLFDNVKPSEIATDNFIDHRCFYIMNKLLDETVKDITVDLQPALCSDITFGTKTQNDEQYITIQGLPEEDGFVILTTEFGMPVTCYFDGDWDNFAVELQTKLREGSYCQDIEVIVDPTAVSWTDNKRYIVTYKGDLKNRKMKLIKVVQNNLIAVSSDEYRILSTADGLTKINVTKNISTDAPIPGSLWVYNTEDDLYENYVYTTYSTNQFTLSGSLTFTPSAGDELWVDMPSQETSTVEITSKQEGWPINQTAPVLSSDTDSPDFTDAGSSLDVGLLRPQEGFFVWVRRETAEDTVGCQDNFTLIFTGTAEPFPL